MRAYVFLGRDGVDVLTGRRWPSPIGRAPAGWVDGDIVACSTADLVWRLDDELWEVELEEPVTVSRRRLHAQRGRLIRHVETWTSAVARELVEACATRVGEGAVEELTATELDTFAGDVVRYAGEARGDADAAGVGAYIAAHALAGGNKLAAGYDQRFEEERRWQAEWLKERLLL